MSDKRSVLTRLVVWLAPKIDVALQPFGLWLVFTFEVDEAKDVMRVRNVRIARRNKF